MEARHGELRWSYVPLKCRQVMRHLISIEARSFSLISFRRNQLANPSPPCFFKMLDHVQQGRPTIIKGQSWKDLESCLASEIPPSFVSLTMCVIFDPESPQIVWRFPGSRVFFVSRRSDGHAITQVGLVTTFVSAHRKGLIITNVSEITRWRQHAVHGPVHKCCKVTWRYPSHSDKGVTRHGHQTSHFPHQGIVWQCNNRTKFHSINSTGFHALPNMIERRNRSIRSYAGCSLTWCSPFMWCANVSSQIAWLCRWIGRSRSPHR